jgi:hypothetical protein
MSGYALPKRRAHPKYFTVEEWQPYLAAVHDVTEPRARIAAMMELYRSIPQGCSAERGYHATLLETLRESIVDVLDDILAKEPGLLGVK